MRSGWSVTWATLTATGVATVTEIDVLDPDIGLATAKGMSVALTSGATAAGDVLSIAQTVSVSIAAGDLFAAEVRLALVSPSFYPESQTFARRTRKVAALVYGTIDTFEVRIVHKTRRRAGTGNR